MLQEDERGRQMKARWRTTDERKRITIESKKSKINNSANKSGKLSDCGRAKTLIMIWRTGEQDMKERESGSCTKQLRTRNKRREAKAQLVRTKNVAGAMEGQWNLEDKKKFEKRIRIEKKANKQSDRQKNMETSFDWVDDERRLIWMDWFDESND